MIQLFWVRVWEGIRELRYVGCCFEWVYVCFFLLVDFSVGVVVVLVSFWVIEFFSLMVGHENLRMGDCIRE